MLRLLVLLATPLLLWATSGATAARAADRPPNIVLLIGDDLGWPYAGFMGHPVVRTPNLDALAASGTTFVNAQSPSSVCTPAMRALLAGVHTEQWARQRAQLEPLRAPLPRHSEVRYYRTVPRELARHGYLAWEGGKLWEGTYANAGFTHGLATELPTLFTSVGDDFGRTGWKNGTALVPLQAFLDQVTDEPFFLWIAPMLPHWPLDAPAEFWNQYAGLGLPSLVASYYANVGWLDAFVGAVLAELDARGLRDDTLIVFVSDNGLAADQPIAGEGQTKGTLYEMGFRQPLVLSWPGHIPAGVTREDLIPMQDVAATLLDYAQTDQLEDGGGRSLRPALETGATAGRDRIVGSFHGVEPRNDGFWVRTPQWRYLTAADGREELYAIDVDPYEQTDVAALHPELLEQFRADVAAWPSRLDTGRTTVDVAGRITDAGQSPLTGERVELRGHSDAGERIELRVLTSVRGDFLFESVPPGTYVVRAPRSIAVSSSIGERGLEVSIPAGSLDQFVPLSGQQPPARRSAGSAIIHGAVLDARGRPVADASVTMHGPRVSLTLRSGPDGRYRAEWLPPGAYHLTAKTRTASGLHVGRTSTAIAGSEERALDVVLGD